MPTVIVHLLNEDSVLGEVDELPQKGDSLLHLKNPRRKDGKDVSYLEPNVTQVYWPLHKVTLIEIMPGADDEEIISPVRE